MKLQVIIPTYNRRNLLKGCLASLKNQTVPPDKILVVVDGSTDGTLKMLEKDFPDLDILKGNGEWWWSKSVNNGIKQTLNNAVTHFLLLNDDTLFPLEFFEELLQVISENQGKTLINIAAKDIKNHEWSYLGVKKSWKNPFKSVDFKEIYLSSPPKYINVSSLVGRGLIIPSFAINDVGFFDEKNFPQAIADSDFSLRASKKGYSLVVATKPYLFSYTKETSRKHYEKTYNIRNMFKRLFAKKSSSNLIYLFKYNLRHCPKKYLIQYTIINFSAVFGGYIRRWINSRM
jgi:GT2 family glycosyltransferase